MLLHMLSLSVFQNYALLPYWSPCLSGYPVSFTVLWFLCGHMDVLAPVISLFHSETIHVQIIVYGLEYFVFVMFGI